MSRDEVILRFEEVCFEYTQDKTILDEVSFSMRRNSKLRLWDKMVVAKVLSSNLSLVKLNPNQEIFFCGKWRYDCYCSASNTTR